MQHTRITAAGTFGETDPDILAAVAKVRPDVIKLAWERHKPWPEARADRDAHETYIRSIEIDIEAVATTIGWTGADLERTARADIDYDARRERRPALPAPVERIEVDKAVRDAESSLKLAEAAADEARLGQERSAKWWVGAVERADAFVEQCRASLAAAQRGED